MGLLDQRVAVVTGAGRGIGREIALCLASEGASVVVNDLGASLAGEGAADDPASETVQNIKDAGGKAVANGDSVADFEGAGRIIAQAVDTFGQIDILVNNAGIVRDRSLLKMEESDYDAVIAVHQKGTFNCTRHAAPLMKEQRLRTHREHHVLGRSKGKLRADELRGSEGRHHGDDLRVGTRAREVRDHRQRDGACGIHSHDREPLRWRRCPTGAGPRSQRSARRLPRVRGGFLCERAGARPYRATPTPSSRPLDRWPSMWNDGRMDTV